MCGKEKNDKDWYEVDDGAFLGCYVAFIHSREKDGIDEVMFHLFKESRVKEGVVGVIIRGRLLVECRCCEECEGGGRKTRLDRKQMS